MNNLFLNRAKSFRDTFIGECFKTIEVCCSTQAKGHLHFNSSEYIFMDKNESGKYVPFVHTRHRGDVEMYSEDGWINVEEIAHWTDVAQDIVYAIVSGCAEHYGYKK